MEFKPGNLAWACSLRKFPLQKDQWWFWPFLVIGSLEHFRILLVNNDIVDFSYNNTQISVCDDTIATQFQINPEYLGARIKKIPYCNLGYYGKTCLKCHDKFDYLNYDNPFICWKCRL